MRQRRLCMIAAAVLVGITACARLPSGQENKEAAHAVVMPEYPAAIPKEDWEERIRFIQENHPEEEFMKQLANFTSVTASRLLKGGTENANYSPVSLYYALALSQMGAGGSTAEELGNLTGIQDEEFLASQCGKLFRLLYKDNEISKLKLANSLWMDVSCSWKPDFETRALNDFYASLHSVDFKEKEAARLAGEWIGEQTNQTIKPELEFSDGQLSAIINTIYFYDQWIDRFDKNKTQKDLFYPETGEPEEMEFMNAVFSAHGFAKGENYTRSALGLKENGSMVFILPDEGTGVDQLLKDPQTLTEALNGGENGSGEVVFQVPKFSIDSEFTLSELLRDLGIKTAFTEDADFSGMTDEPLFISDVIQQSHIAVNENGVEASAFTVIEYCGASLPEGRAEMILNRPFLYAVTDNSGGVLFLGVVRK